MMEPLDLKLLKIAQEGVELTERPYLLMAQQLGISEEEVIRRLKRMEAGGVIRRFAATIGHRALGIVANAMIVWKVPPSEIKRTGAIFASREDVTHCYERAIAPDWPYNLYTMVHARCKEDCLRVASELSKASGIEEYRVLFSEKEYKKTSARI